MRVASLTATLCRHPRCNDSAGGGDSNRVTHLREQQLLLGVWHRACSYVRMRSSLDAYLGIHPQALTLEAKRNELLAANLANVDTPNYKARDIDFKTALAAAGAEPASTAQSTSAPLLRAANASPEASAHAPAPGGSDTSIDRTVLRYRVPMAPALDGNTVDEQLEQAAFAENNVRYQATLTFLNNAFRGLMTAITGS
jgi:flagellar basal-body rod protein FlgB